MDVDCRAKLGKTPRRAGMIEMDVAQECMTHVRGRETNLGERCGNIFESRFRPDIEKREPVVGFEGGCGDNSRPAQHFRV